MIGGKVVLTCPQRIIPWLLSYLVLALQTCSVRHEQPYHLEIVPPCRNMQSRASCIVSVYLCASLKKLTSASGHAFPSGHHKRGHVFFAYKLSARVRICTSGKGSNHRSLISPFDCIEQRLI